MAVQKYKLQYKKSVEKDLRKLPPAQLKAIVAKIQKSASDPRAQDAVKLRGSSDLYRVRSSEYRIIYRVQDDLLIVLVVKVGHRRETYRGIGTS